MRPTTKLSTVLPLVLAFLSSCSLSIAHTAEEWKGKSVYQLITDRFAPVSGSAPARTADIPTVCDPKLQTWCGGTWLSIIDKLDYIQGMGFDAIWISPVSMNIDIHTPYNYGYHGYWVTDPTQLNPRFGTSDDLHSLVNALHSRGMWIMVDIVVNNIPSLSVNDSTSTSALLADKSYYTDPSDFHDFCWVDYSNQTSCEYCWLGDENLPLMDVNTENPAVISLLQSWIYNLTSTYNIDGLRIDAAKHVNPVFWPGFCGAAGVFCIGEVYDPMGPFPVQFQTQKWMDSILGYPLYYGIQTGFGSPNANMSAFTDVASAVLSQFPNPMVLGNFIENHDLPRWLNVTVDPQLGYNALIAQFIFDGIPIVYYGQEQNFANGNADPYNRAALWPSNYTNTTTYNRIATLNSIRHDVISNNTLFQGKNFINSSTVILANTSTDVAFRKGPLVAVLTNRGSPSQDATFGVPASGFTAASSIIDVMSCRSFTVGAGGTISVSYAASGYGGMPYLFMSQADMTTLGWCGLGSTSEYSAAQHSNSSSSTGSASAIATLPQAGLIGAGVLVLVVAGTFGSFFA